MITLAVPDTLPLPEKAEEKKWLWPIFRHRQEELRRRRTDQRVREWMQEKAGGVLDKLNEYLADGDYCRTVYDDALQRWLDREGRRPLWQQCWPYESFDSWREEGWLEALLETVHIPHYIVLGYERYLPELLCSRARYLRSLRLITDYQPLQLEDLLDELYEEYGLAADYKLLPTADRENATAYRTFRINSAVPVIVLDFSGEERILTAGVPAGSIWVDMDSLEEKRRRIEERNTKIAYISLKKQLKQAAYALDTQGQNGYNVRVNQEYTLCSTSTSLHQ